MIKEKYWGLKEASIPSSTNTLLQKRTHSLANFFTMTGAIAAVLMSVLISEDSFAAEGEVPLMDKVVVTATRREEKISTIPANITVISEHDIAQSTAVTVPGLLRNTPGILVNDITGNGRSITVDIMGFGESAGANTLVLIDGRRINQTDLSNTDWTLIPKNRVQRIEIVRGSRGSVFYGDNAAAGVVNIITKKGEEAKVTANLAVGSYKSLNGSAGVSGSTEKLSYAVNANYFTTDGYRDNSDADAKDLGLNADFYASDKVKIYMSAGYHEDETRLPGAITETDFANGVSRTASLHPDDFSEIKDYYVQAAPEIFFTDTSYIKIEASTRTRQNDSFISFSDGSSLYSTEIDTVAVSPQIVLNEKVFGHTSKLTAGLDYNDSKLEAQNEALFFGTPSSLSAQLSKENWGYYLHEEFAITDELSASAGARYDRVKLNFPANSSPDQVEMDEESYTAGLTYLFNQKVSAFASYSTSFRYPLLDEIFDIFTNSFNSTLTSQTGDDYEVGLRFQVNPETSLGVNLFRIKTEDEIFYNPISFSNMNFDGDILRQGIELTASKIISGILLTGSYTYRDSEIDGGAFDGNEVPNVPHHQGTLGAEFEPYNNVIVNLNGSYVGERVFISDFANTHDKQDDYFYLTGKLTYMLEKGSLYVAVNNILNEKYSEFGALDWAGKEGFYPSPQINFWAGVNFEF